MSDRVALKVTKEPNRSGRLVYKYSCHLCQARRMFGQGMAMHLVKRHGFSRFGARKLLIFSAGQYDHNHKAA